MARRRAGLKAVILNVRITIDLKSTESKTRKIVATLLAVRNYRIDKA